MPRRHVSSLLVFQGVLFQDPNQIGHTIQRLKAHRRLGNTGDIIGVRITKIRPVARETQRGQAFWENDEKLLTAPTLPIADLKPLTTKRMKWMRYLNRSQGIMWNRCSMLGCCRLRNCTQLRR